MPRLRRKRRTRHAHVGLFEDCSSAITLKIFTYASASWKHFIPLADTCKYFSGFIQRHGRELFSKNRIKVNVLDSTENPSKISIVLKDFECEVVSTDTRSPPTKEAIQFQSHSRLFHNSWQIVFFNLHERFELLPFFLQELIRSSTQIICVPPFTLLGRFHLGHGLKNILFSNTNKLSASFGEINALSQHFFPQLQEIVVTVHTSERNHPRLKWGHELVTKVIVLGLRRGSNPNLKMLLNIAHPLEELRMFVPLSFPFIESRTLHITNETNSFWLHNCDFSEINEVLEELTIVIRGPKGWTRSDKIGKDVLFVAHSCSTLKKLKKIHFKFDIEWPNFVEIFDMDTNQENFEENVTRHISSSIFGSDLMVEASTMLWFPVEVKFTLVVCDEDGLRDAKKFFELLSSQCVQELQTKNWKDIDGKGSVVFELSHG